MGEFRQGGNGMKAYIILNDTRDHAEPWDYEYCKQLVEKLDPNGEILELELVEE